jgi:hypothetical protein
MNRIAICALVCALAAFGQLPRPGGGNAGTSGPGGGPGTLVPGFGLSCVGDECEVNTSVITSRSNALEGKDNDCTSASASATAYTCSLPFTLEPAMLVTSGTIIDWKPDVACDSNPTLNVDGTGAFPVYEMDAATQTTSCTVGFPYRLMYSIASGGRWIKTNGPKMPLTIQMATHAMTIGGTAGVGTGWLFPAASGPTGPTATGALDPRLAAFFLTNATNIRMVYEFWLPPTWDAGALRLRLATKQSATGVTGVRVGILCAPNGTANIASLDWTGVTYSGYTTLNHTDTTSLFNFDVPVPTANMLNCSPGSLAFIAFERDAADANAGNMSIYGAMLTGKQFMVE